MPQLFTRIFIALLLLCNAAFAQRPLTDSRQNSYYTYIYKLSDADVRAFYKSPGKPFDDKVLRNPVDSFKTDKYWENTLPPGNYVKAYAEQNRLRYSLIENHSAFLKLFTSKYEHRFILTDKKGAYITTAAAWLNGKKVPYDERSGTWYFKRGKSINTVQVDYAGVSNFYTVAPTKEYDYYQSPQKSWYASLWASIKSIFKKNESNRYTPRPYTGFMVFNKPIYKLGDTVKLKAFIFTQRDKKPIAQKKLLVKLVMDGERKNIGEVTAYRDGGFEYSFVLSDTLKLELDERYEVLLTDPAKTPKNKDDDDQDGDHKNKDLVYSGNFQYEEYELKSIKFEMRADKKEHWPGSPQVVYLKATDENNLPVADGRVTLTLKTGNITSQKTNHQYIPDTLWVHKFPLDAVGETKITIPDSIFPKADINYSMEAEFLNADNERQNQWASANFLYQKFNIATDVVNDSLKIDYQHLGKPANGNAFVSALNAAGDTLFKEEIALPGFVKVKPGATAYNIETDSASSDIEMKDFEGNISLSGERTADSLFVNVNNPRKLHFFYSVFANGKLLDGGKATELFYKKVYPSNKPVNFRVNYIWAGQVQTQDANLAYRKDLLTINVRQPVSVYPGQKAQTDIVVTDAAGRPIANTDVTAWALTKKFNYGAPNTPFLGKPYYAAKGKKQFKMEETEINGAIKLNWLRWIREIGLDSIAYYQFTHPKTTYRLEEPGIDTITQIAPFIVQGGDIIPVHILYIDYLPVYFSQAKQMQPYSFKVRPGYHSLMFRTATQNIQMDSVLVQKSKKLILSINADTYPVIKTKDTLSFAEADNVNKYLISVVNNFDGKRALIAQTDRIFFLNPYSTAESTVLTGPLSPNYTVFDRQGDKPQPFIAESNYSYWFAPGLIRQKSISASYPFSHALANISGNTNYKQYVLSNNATDSLWQDYLDQRSNSSRLFNNPAIADKESGRLTIRRKVVENEKMVLIKNVILYRYNNPDFIRIYPGSTTDFGKLSKGNYRMLFLLKGDTYDIKENIAIKAYGINYYEMSVLPAHAKDSVSIKIGRVIGERKSEVYRNFDNQIENDELKLKEIFNEKYFNTSDFSQMVTGKLIGSDDKLPIVGATIKVKGTTNSAVTSINGTFRLRVPPNGKLVASYLGYYTQEVDFISGTNVKITMHASQNQLQEVVVVGYSTTRRKDMTGAISYVTAEQFLQGKVSGITVVSEGTPGAGLTIQVRGLSSVAGKTPIYVIDGEIVTDLKGISPGDIGEISVLKDAAATAIYGSRGANGVIIITKKTSANALVAPADAPVAGQQTLRKNFSDYAYWQPKLTTDANGKASFTSVFPDDITNWRTFVIAVNGQRQSGFAEQQIKSFKPVSANFIAPQFAVAGDEMSLIGKVMNYNSTPITANRTFKYNGAVLKQDDIQVANAKIDTLNITATNADSLEFEYSIARDNGYFDGEKRKIPVVKQGVQETIGVFEALDRDTTITLKFDAAMGPVTFRAEASALPALAEEAKHLREYKYLCNEQLASKLKGLLAEKRIQTFLNLPFKYERNILDIIKKLQDGRNTSGIWGWWANSNDELWLSLHTVEALLDAKTMGYTVNVDQPKLTAYLVYQLESYRGEEKLACLQLLYKTGARVDYTKYFGVIEKEYKTQKDVPNYNRLRLMLLKQEAGLTVKTDSLLTAVHKTMFGNLYWGEEGYRFFDNSIQVSVLAYQIIKAEGKHPEVLAKIRGYFLEQRSHGEWRNTYESALILETILPDLLKVDSELKPAVLTIKGAATETITAFPYTTTLKDNQISISKTGSLPVYITGYQQFWNSKPEKVNKDFTVDTWVEKNGDKRARLKGGEAVQLKAEVTVNGDADFVMVEIPIPAGCSYDNKAQQWANNEVHREFFKEKVSIFCRKLKEGKYTFTVNLMPRYGGNYNLNPAKAEQMYFPVFYGREGMKKVMVGD